MGGGFQNPNLQKTKARVKPLTQTKVALNMGSPTPPLAMVNPFQASITKAHKIAQAGFAEVSLYRLL